MIGALKQFFSSSNMQMQAYEAYTAIVGQARNPVFYQQWQVEDSLDGRFDCIVLHLCLVLQRLEQEDATAEMRSFVQYMSEAFFADMDRSLREMGASDTGVGHKVKKMAQAFYGRKKAYGDAMGDETALREALLRNVYRDKAVPAECVASLAAYMGHNATLLQEQGADALIVGKIRFSS
jgi:cytochrome b pre-mRNA-processing protein 3